MKAKAGNPIFLVLIFLLPSILGAHSSKTFFMPRAIGSDLVLQHAGTNNFIKNNEPAERYFSSSTLFYQNSTNSNDLAKYFFPSGKTELQIKGALAAGPRDISGTWLQIAGKNNPGANAFPDGTAFDGATARADVELYLNEFASKIKISPEYKSFGSVVQFYKNFDCISDRLWASVTLPFVQVETNANLQEFDKVNSVDSRNDLENFKIDDGNAVSGDIKRLEAPSLANRLNAIEAFNNPLWSYGKIKNGAQRLAGLADIHAKLGYQVVKQSSVCSSVYGSLVIPMGYKPTTEFVFEPLVGNGQHWALGAGISADVEVLKKENTSVSFSSNLDYLYLFSNMQKRSFDLKNNGEWSRYLLVSDLKEAPNSLSPTLQPGINFFTLNTSVEPKHEINWISSCNAAYKNLAFEAGYNLWFKNKEALMLKDAMPNNLGIAGENFGAVSALEAFEVNTFSKATIGKHLSDRLEYDINNGGDVTTFLKAEDLDLNSGAHPSRLSHKIYVAVVLNTEWKNNQFLWNIGSSYEVSSNNAALEAWALWLKMSISV